MRQTLRCGLGLILILATLALREALANESSISTFPAPPRKSIVLFLAGDVLPGRGVRWRLQQGKTTLKAFQKQISEADVAFCNLEGALFTSTTRSKPHFELGDLQSLEDAGFDVVSQANNHALDAGESGLQVTLRRLEALKIAAVGARVGQRGAMWSPVEVDRSGWRLAFVAATLWGPFAVGNAEVRRLEREALIRHVRGLAASGSTVIVSLHWGREGYTQPFPEQRHLACDLIDAGAVIIVGHHPHVAGVVETYKGRPIFYSLGNFLWDRMPTRQSGLAVQVTLSEGEGRTQLSYKCHRVIPDAICYNTTVNY